MTLDDTVASLADRLGRPVVLYDVDLNLIAFSAHGEDVDEVRRSVILSRHGTTRAAQMIRQSGASRAREPVRIPIVEDTGIPGRVIYALRRRDRLVGYVAYIDDAPHQPLPGPHREALHDAGGELSEQVFARQVDRVRGHERIAASLRKLLSPEPRDRQAAGRDLVAGGQLAAANAYTAVVLTTGPEQERQAEPLMLPERSRLRLEDALTELLRQAPARAVGAVLDTRAVLVYPRGVDQARFAAQLDRAGGADVRAGLGQPRPSLDTVVESFHQAVISALAAWLDVRTHGTVASWDTLGVDRLLLRLPLLELTAADLPAPVQRLLTAVSGPDLAKTLEQYLESGGDAQATARSLLIHRSTLYYRLDRIRQITGVDLADGGVRRELHVGLRVATLCGLRS
jgi:hypothetical protein